MCELSTLLAEIASLLAQAERDDDPARLERTLTDGYARALWLEAERSRLERQVGEMTARLGDDRRTSARELSTLVRRLETQDATIGRLRSELGRLRLRHSLAVRGAAR